MPWGILPSRTAVGATACSQVAGSPLGHLPRRSRRFPQEGARVWAPIRAAVQQARAPFFRAAVSAAAATKYPTVRGVLQRMSTAPGSNLQYLSEEKLINDFTNATNKKEAAPWKHRRIMCEEAERKGVRKQLQPVYAHAADLLHDCGARAFPSAFCPGLS